MPAVTTEVTFTEKEIEALLVEDAKKAIGNDKGLGGLQVHMDVDKDGHVTGVVTCQGDKGKS